MKGGRRGSLARLEGGANSRKSEGKKAMVVKKRPDGRRLPSQDEEGCKKRIPGTGDKIERAEASTIT